ncbi:hypothetical protein CL654_03145 [bacterium]|nr:hypothetical protein [bacterium]|tara:strand:+ start:13177 stop:13740 length:564 start_codon:yes stop_codon:yes gene_type:complete
MKRLFIIHGWGGNPDEKLLRWLGDECKQEGFEVVIPRMPNTDEPVIEEWIGHIKDIVGAPDEETFFIGHSIGCQAIMRYLETINEKIGGAVFMGGWFTLTGIDDLEDQEIVKPWEEENIDFGKIKEVTSNIVVVLSDDDPYVPYKDNKERFEKYLNAKIITEHNKGHFTNDDGVEDLSSVKKALLDF